MVIIFKEKWLLLHSSLLSILQVLLLVNSNQEPQREEDLGKHGFQSGIPRLHILLLKESQICVAQNSGALGGVQAHYLSIWPLMTP